VVDGALDGLSGALRAEMHGLAAAPVGVGGVMQPNSTVLVQKEGTVRQGLTLSDFDTKSFFSSLNLAP